MSFDALETSRYGGKPVHLFVFKRQGIELRFVGSDRDFINGLTTYTAGQIERSEIKQTVERAKDRVTIKLAYLRDPNAPAEDIPSTQTLGDWWHPYIPGDRIDVICLAAHRGDSSAPVVEWMGKVVQPKFGDVELELVCEPYGDEARNRNQGPRFQKGCWKSNYSTGIRGCNLDPAPLSVTSVVTAVSGLQLTAAAFASSLFPLGGGKATWVRSDGIVEQRTITQHAGDTITLLYGGLGLEAGVTSVTVLPNCPKTWAACDARGNTINYGGAIYKPQKNPMQGVSMSWG